VKTPSARLNSATMRSTPALKLIKPGADEGDILAAMQGAIFAGGGDYPANEFILGSGADALLCRYKAGRRKLTKNDQLTLEWAGVFAPLPRADDADVLTGKVSKRHQELYDASRDALEAVEKAMVTGNTFGDVFEAHARIAGERTA
jgi:Xaa-Pro dipeptidase